MTRTSAIDTISWERDFKVLCDGLLRFELGRLVQTFGSDGSDGGVDAEFVGAIDGVNGRWVFQYKFRSPKEALSKRRSWLTQRFAETKGKHEFDKDGVRAANGYILLTNIPITPSIVQKLQREWRKRKHEGPLCVWDPSRLNELMRGREHLARSWTGAKEARCRQAIVLPLWQWIDSAMTAAANWMDDPLWPLEVRPYHHVLPLGAFNRSFEGRDGLSIAPRKDALDAVSLDPQFHYAATVVYPRAFQPFGAVQKSVDVLGSVVLRHVDALCDEISARLPQLHRLGEQRAEATQILAYCVLESRWGFPKRGLHSIRDGKLVAQARYYAWSEAQLMDIEPTLDALVREAPRGVVGEGVDAARAEVASVVENWWERMWHVVSFGVDTETTNESVE